jgi:hypothetical protein
MRYRILLALAFLALGGARGASAFPDDWHMCDSDWCRAWHLWGGHCEHGYDDGGATDDEDGGDGTGDDDYQDPPPDGGDDDGGYGRHAPPVYR